MGPSAKSQLGAAAGRDWSVATKAVKQDDGKVVALELVRVDWRAGDDGRMAMREIPGSGFEIAADLVLLAMGFEHQIHEGLLAMGFEHPIHEGLLESLGVELDAPGNVAADTEGYQTSAERIFAAGDVRRGQSLVVWAIHEGRRCARAVDIYLTGSSNLPG